MCSLHIPAINSQDGVSCCHPQFIYLTIFLGANLFFIHTGFTGFTGNLLSSDNDDIMWKKVT